MSTEKVQHRAPAAFTVIELVVAVLIVGILTIFAVIAYQLSTSNSREAVTEANLRTVAAVIVAEHHAQGEETVFTRDNVLEAVSPVGKEIVDGGVSASSGRWVFYGADHSPQQFGDFAIGFDNGPGTTLNHWSGTRVTILTSSGTSLFGRTVSDSGTHTGLGELDNGLTIPDIIDTPDLETPPPSEPEPDPEPEPEIPDEPAPGDDEEAAALRGELVLTYSTWSGSCTDNTVLLPVWGPFSDDSVVDWGDGQVEPLTDLMTHTYNNGGEYTVSVTGTFTRFGTETDHPYRGCLTHVDRWEKTGVKSTSGAYRNETALQSTVAPPSTVTDMSYMFTGITVWFPLQNWDVSNVQDFTGMFQNTSAFNSPIGDWNMSAATDLSYMFAGTDTFSQNLSNWDTSNVRRMVGTFAETHSFNGEVNGWDTAQVTDMSDMFTGSRTFNKDVDRWDVSSLQSAARMFKGAQSFNGKISAWDVSAVPDLREMFRGAVSFNGDLSTWDVGNALTDNMLTGSQTGAPDYNHHKRPPALR